MNELVLQECRQSIAKGSKTFTFASRFFAQQKMEDAALLYQWCRHCDDAIDASAPDQKERALDLLNNFTQNTLAGSPPEEVSFQALHHVVQKHKIPDHYPLELIAGMAMDTHFEIPETMEELDLYCYRVAGVVGLMMAHVMGISDERALKNACDLGIAMQLTNIARDVLADHELKRCYLPLDLLKKYSLDKDTFAEPQNREKLTRVVNELLDRADQFYKSGEAGTLFLDRKSALVILIARFTYARIGQKVRNAGIEAWDKRQITGGFEKLFCLGQALKTWLYQTLRWGPRSHPSQPIRQIWRFP